MSNRNLSGIQYLRGFAAASVVLYHASRQGAMGQPVAGSIYLTALGTFAVQLFFVISGFIITIVSLDHKGQPKISPSAFAAKRFVRIVPFMWICTLTYFALALIGGVRIDVWELGQSLLLWPTGNLKPGLLWTLRLELIFYFVFGLTLLSHGSRWWILVIWACLPLIVRAGEMWTPSEAGGDDPIWIVAMGHQAGANIQFGLGIVLGFCWLNVKQTPQRPSRIGFPTVLGLGILSAGLSEALSRSELPEMQLIVLNSLICFGLVGSSLLVTIERTLFDSVGRILGDASYSIYLTHILPLLIVSKLAGSDLASYNAILVCGALTFIGIAFGCMVHRFLEMPIIRLANRFLPARNLQ